MLVVQHAATVYALAMMRERMAAEVTRQLRNELLEGLLLGHLTDLEEVVRRAERIGFGRGCTYQVLVLAPEDLAPPMPDAGADAHRAAGRRRRLLDGLAELVASRASDAIVSPQEHELVVILPVTDAPHQSAKDLGHAAIRHAATLFNSWSLTVGIGGACQRTDRDRGLLRPGAAGRRGSATVRAARRGGSLRGSRAVPPAVPGRQPG